MAEFDKHGPASSSGSAFVASSASTALDCSPSTSADPNTESCSGRLALVSHKVTQRDTLAGLAIRYNVSVGDIKRANGLLSDNALYARETIQIPTQGLPLGEELQLIFAQVATGFGRDPVLNAEANLHPASAAAARVARTLNIINGQSYPPDDINSLPWWCRCGTCDEAEDRGMCRSRQFTDSDDEPQEYEMQDRTGVLLPPDSAGPTRLTEHIRRRAARYSDGPDMDGDMGHGQPLLNGGTHSAYRSRGRPPRPQPPPGGPSAGGAALQGEGLGAVFKQISDFGKSLKDISIIQKIKAAASQPALAGGQGHSFSEAAEGVLGSFKLSHKLGKGPPAGGGSALTSLPLSRSSAAGTSAGTHRRKTGDKDD